MIARHPRAPAPRTKYVPPTDLHPIYFEDADIREGDSEEDAIAGYWRLREYQPGRACPGGIEVFGRNQRLQTVVSDVGEAEVLLRSKRANRRIARLFEETFNE